MATWRGVRSGLLALVAACGGAEPASTAAPPRADRVGPGWRARGSALEFLGAGVRVVLPTGWRVLTPAQALYFRDEGVAVAPAEPREPARYLAITGRPIGRVRPLLAQAALAGRDLDGVTPVGPPVIAVIGGQRFAVQRTVTADEVRDHASAIVDGRYVAFTLVTPAALAEADRPRLEALLTGTVFLDAAARAALAADLMERPALQDEWGADFADHGQRFFDFAGRWTWRHPPGVWQVEGLMPTPDDPTRFHALEVVTGTSVFVSREPWSGSVEAYLADYIGAPELEVGGGATTLAGYAARYVDVVDPGWMGLHSRTIAAVIADRALVLQLTNRGGAPTESLAQAAAAALALTPAMVELEPGLPYRNWRFGVTVDLPRSFARRPVEADARTVLDEMWTAGRTSVELTVYSINSKRGTTADPVERYLASWPGLRRRGAPSRSRVIVDGWPAIRLAWRAKGWLLEATLVERIDTVVELTVQGRADTGVRVVGADVLRFLR